MLDLAYMYPVSLLMPPSKERVLPPFDSVELLRLIVFVHALPDLRPKREPRSAFHACQDDKATDEKRTRPWVEILEAEGR